MSKTPRIVTAGAPARIAMGTICILDDDGTLIDKKAVPVAALASYKPKPNEKAFDHPVDLPPGLYRWTGLKFTLKAGPATEPGPDMVQAFIAAITLIADHGKIDLGPAWRDAVRAWERTVDGQKSFDGGA